MDRRKFLKNSSLGLAAFATLPLTLGAVEESASGASVRAKNILFIVTDDQILATLEYMPKVRRLLADRGMTFERAYAADPVCAPARASILTGKHVHNHGVKSNLRTDEKMRPEEANALPVRLQRLGYRTGMFGKYNTDPQTSSRRVPVGWNTFNSFVAPFNSDGKLWFNSNGRRIAVGNRRGSDCSVLGGMANNFIKNARESGSPWFCYVATMSPHGPYMPSEEHEKMFRNELLPKPPNYNEQDVSDKPKKFQKTYPRISKAVQGEIAEQWRGTLRECQDIDNMVEDLVENLERSGQIENTLIVFVTDNSYPYGHNRAWGGKGWPYSSMTRLPFIVRGVSSGVPENAKSDELVSQVDLLPTCMELAGGRWEDTDGRPLTNVFSDEGEWRKRLFIGHYLNRRWDATVEKNRLYVEHDTGEKELYDLAADPYETESLHETEDEATLGQLSASLKAMAKSAGKAHRATEM